MSQFDFHTRQHPELNKLPTEFCGNDLKHCSIQKDNIDTPNGLVIERRAGTKEYYIKEVTPGGLFQQLHGNRIQEGDRLVKVNGKHVDEFTSLWDINDTLKKSLQLTIHVQRGGLHLQPKQEWKPAEYAPGNPTKPWIQR
jgi:PDZ domain